MKVEVKHCYRCYPSVTINKFKKIKGSGTAFITELIRSGHNQEWLWDLRKWRRIDDDEIINYAAKGYNILYKTASLSRCHKVYANK